LLISSFCFYRVSNRHTFGEIFQIDLPDESIKQRHREMICESVLRYLQPDNDACRASSPLDKLQQARHKKIFISDHALKVRQHALRIRHHAAEQFKRLHRLKHRHVAAIQRAAPRARALRSSSVSSGKYTISATHSCAQQGTGTGMPGSLAMPIGVVFTRPSAWPAFSADRARHGATAAEMLVEVVRQALARSRSTSKILSCCTPSLSSAWATAAPAPPAPICTTRSRHVLQATAKAFGKTQAIGVVADALAVLEHHGVHRADAPGFRRQFVEQRMIACLHGKVMFSPVKFMRSAACSRSGRALLSSCN
jgi:hypothetical protein